MTATTHDPVTADGIPITLTDGTICMGQKMRFKAAIKFIRLLQTIETEFGVAGTDALVELMETFPKAIGLDDEFDAHQSPHPDDFVPVVADFFTQQFRAASPPGTPQSDPPAAEPLVSGSLPSPD